MSLRSLFVISLNDSTILYHKIFPSVEDRWAREHPLFYKSLPKGEELIHLLRNELGLVSPSTFVPGRDSCAQDLAVPLFWVPHEASARSWLWPVTVVESQSRLFCAVPYIKQLRSDHQPPASDGVETTLAFEVLTKLLPVAELAVDQTGRRLSAVVRRWLPFGRPVGLQGLELLARPWTSGGRGLWSRSRPALEARVREEVRAVLTRAGRTVDVLGTVSLALDAADVDVGEVRARLAFAPKLASSSSPSSSFRPGVATHSSCHLAAAAGDETAFDLTLRPANEKVLPVCHYSVSLDEAPVEATLRTRADGRRCSVSVRLRSNPRLARCPFGLLEVHVALPNGIRCTQVVTVGAQIPAGSVSLQKGGATLVWHVTGAAAPASGAGPAKLQDGLVMGVDVLLDRADVSLADTRALVVFTSTNWTLSGAQLTFTRPPKLKLVTVQELKSSAYCVWNDDAVDVD